MVIYGYVYENVFSFVFHSYRIHLIVCSIVPAWGNRRTIGQRNIVFKYERVASLLCLIPSPVYFLYHSYVCLVRLDVVDFL